MFSLCNHGFGMGAWLRWMGECFRWPVLLAGLLHLSKGKARSPFPQDSEIVWMLPGF